jgi:hypothetical protein
MTPQEKVLYHQIHPAKIAADVSGSAISTYLMWYHHFWAAMLGAFVPAIVGSALVLRFANLESIKESRFGRYVKSFMNRWIEAWRFSGQIVMWFGAWYRRWWAIPLGIVVVVAAWMSGLFGKPRSGEFETQ